MKQHVSHEKGYVALMSMMLISAILLSAVFTLYASSFFSRFDALDNESKHTSLGLAEACVHAASLKIAQDAHYAPAPEGDCVSVGSSCAGSGSENVCMICAVTHTSQSSVIDIRARYAGTYTNLRVSLMTTPATFQVIDWEELPQGDSTCVPR